MWTSNLQIPLLWIALFLAALCITSILCGIGSYYLISKKFNIFALIISAVILLAFLTFRLLNNWSEPFDSNLIVLGFPYSILGYLFPLKGLIFSLFCLIAIVLNYLALFSIVNFVQRTATRLNS